MCSPDGTGRPDPIAFRNNLAVPMPLPKKIGLVLKNNSLKLVRLKNCCGNHGEPGC